MNTLQKKLIIILGVSTLILVAAVVIGAIFLKNAMAPVATNSTEIQRFVIPRNQSVAVIGQRLYEAGLIKNPTIFKLWVRYTGSATALQAGSFDISPGSSLPEIATQLTTGTQDVWITLLEGWRVEEIAEYLANQGLDSFDSSTFLALAKPYEGTLFPDTYLVPREISAESLVTMLTTTFEQKKTTALAKEVAASERSFEESLIMASIVQREARDAEQMRHVAGILWNRIAIGMALQVDATLQYSKGGPGKWWPTPLAVDKTINSPFNTYQNPGLPPRPISNPGLDALRAALDPLVVDDLYYLHDPDTGLMYYARTLEEHNANITKYLR